MKKIYVKPIIKDVMYDLGGAILDVVSPNAGIGNGTVDAGLIESRRRRYDVWDEEDEEEE